MSDGDPFWGAPPPREASKRTRPAKPVAAPKEGPDTDSWTAPAGPPRARWRRLPIPLRAILAGAATAWCIALAAIAGFSQSTSQLPRGPGVAGGTPPVLAQVILPPDDTRTFDQVCGDYDVPADLCALSRDCLPTQGAGAAAAHFGGGRTISLVLRASNSSCAGIANLAR